MSTPETKIHNRLVRTAMYFPKEDVRGVITIGASKKPATQITEKEAKAGLWETEWSLNLLNYLADEQTPLATREAILVGYIDAVKALKGRKEFFWEVDQDIHVRLVHKLGLDLEQFTKPLAEPLKGQIQDISKLFEAEVKARVEKKRAGTQEYLSIFNGKEYEEMNAVILGRHTVFTAKNCKKLLAPSEKRALFIQLFFKGLNGPHAKLAIAKKLVSEFEKHFGEYNQEHRDTLPEEIVQLGKSGLEAYKTLSQM